VRHRCTLQMANENQHSNAITLTFSIFCIDLQMWKLVCHFEGRFRFSWRRVWIWLSSGMLCHIV
jgi:hypothetical protein